MGEMKLKSNRSHTLCTQYTFLHLLHRYLVTWPNAK